MNGPACSSRTGAVCTTDERRLQVLAGGRLGGIDYVEVYPDRTSLCVHFFGRVPPGLGTRNVVIEGGERIRGIKVLDAQFEQHGDGDACLRVVVDQPGDFSPYCLCLVEPEDTATRCSFDPLPPGPAVPRIPEGIDPRHACASFLFRLDCASGLDCKPAPCASGLAYPQPAIDYLARDFTSFRSLMLDRMAVTIPDWSERHIPDIGMTVVELFAYVADQLSYMLDAVATEAYLGTARLRVSVRRHARLLDYRMHEGCNARAWVAIESGADIELPLADLVFAAPPPGTDLATRGQVEWARLQQAGGAILFEPVDLSGTGRIALTASHGTIHFYTWGEHGCCLAAGSTRATLLDEAPGAHPPHARILRLRPGDVLIFEEIRGAATGNAADADPARRHAVRLTSVAESADPLDGTALLEVAWAPADALPFALCLSARTAAPDCRWVEVAVARGNVLLVDHGVTVDETNDGWAVGIDSRQGCCQCAGAASDLAPLPARFSVTLARGGITCASPPAGAQAAGALLTQDPRMALPQVRLDAAETDASAAAAPWNGTYDWVAAADLLSSGPLDRQFVAEIDDEGLATLRFGDGDCGMMPPALWRFRARYRVGNGRAGNVGHDAIVWVADRAGVLSGAGLRPRNPLPAQGGVDPEPVADARQYAPHAYGRVLERAVAAADYAELARRGARIEGAFAELAWNGSWYEADVALDPLAAAGDETGLFADVEAGLAPFRRIGHDLRCVPAHKVPLAIGLRLCVAGGHARADVERAVRDVLSNRRLAGGQLGLFHPDRLLFGADVAASRVTAAVQAVDGIAHVEVLAFARVDADAATAARSLADGVIAIAPDEIAQLDNDPDFPERGTLALTTLGGR